MQAKKKNKNKKRRHDDDDANDALHAEHTIVNPLVALIVRPSLLPSLDTILAC